MNGLRSLSFLTEDQNPNAWQYCARTKSAIFLFFSFSANILVDCVPLCVSHIPASAELFAKISWIKIILILDKALMRNHCSPSLAYINKMILFLTSHLSEVLGSFRSLFEFNKSYFRMTFFTQIFLAICLSKAWKTILRTLFARIDSNIMLSA